MLCANYGTSLCACLWHVFKWVILRLPESVHGSWIGTCDVVMFMWVHGSWIGTCDSGLSNGSFDRYVKACIMCLIIHVM